MTNATIAPQLARLSPVRRDTAGGLDGVSLAIQHWGKADAPVILLLHAFGMNHAMWAPLLAGTLAERFHLVTFDHRGHGESDKPEDPAAYADGRLIAGDIAAVFATLDDARVNVVAWSMSGALFGDYLSHHGGDRIASVTLLAAVNALGPSAFRLGQIGPLFADDTAGLIHSPHLTEQLRGWAHVNRGLTTAPLDAPSWGAVTASAMLLPVAARGALLGRDADHLDAYARLRAPIQAIHAEDDRIVTPAAPRRLAQARAEMRLTLLPDGAHAPHWEHPAEVTAAINKLVR